MTDQNDSPAPPRQRAVLAIAIVLLVGAALVPVSVSLRGSAVFRVPHALTMIAIAIIATTVAATAWSLGVRFEALSNQRVRRIVLLGAIAAVWTLVSTLFSENRAVSLDALPFVFALLAIGVLTALSSRRVAPFAAAIAVALPAIINLIVLGFQASGIWNPWVFTSELSGRMHWNALLGNPNDVGAYFVGPTIFMAALALGASRGRLLYAAAAIAFASGAVLSITLTALSAITVGISVLGVVRYGRRGAAAVAMFGVVLVIAGTLYAPLAERVTRIASTADRTQLDALVSQRLASMIAAAEMFKDNPVTGLGPGGFKLAFVPYRIEATQRYGTLFVDAAPGVDSHFTETHNDHLQVLAESGLPGYALLIAAFVLVGSISLKKKHPATDRVRIARLMALPLSSALAVTMLTGFPLQLAAPAYTFVLLGGLCIAWSSVDDVA